VFAIIGGAPAQFKPLFDYYKNVYEESGHDMANFQVGVHIHSFFGEEGKAVADAYYPVYAAQMDSVGASRGWPPFSRAQFEAGRSKQGALIIGDAAAAIDKILALHDMFGLTRFSAHMDVGAPDHKSMLKSIELLGDVIAPAVRKALA
jgi:alkanesulfonate monooxygenase SsuD/methylene tetrahydromethanopterin reductase-like flavin-dependent oxidoreductase (luciferase family)